VVVVVAVIVAVIVAVVIARIATMGALGLHGGTFRAVG